MKEEFEEIDYIPIYAEQVCDLEYDLAEFKKGIKNGSYYAGLITAIKNTGLDNSDIVEIFKEIINKVKENKK